MHSFFSGFVLTLTLLSFAADAVAGDDTSTSKTGTVQTIKVNGTDLTGLNGYALTDLLKQAKQQGTTSIVVDMGSVSHMTPAGMESLTAGARSFGPDNFAVAKLSGQPAELTQSNGTGRFRSFSTVEEAVAALKD